MTDPNNVPQEAQQLKEDLNNENEETSEQAKSDVASTDFDEEYEIAEKNKTGPGNQTSNPSAVGRKETNPGDTGAGDTGAGDANAGDATQKKQVVDNVDSPGDSDPDDYLDMAKEVTKNVETK